MDFKFRYPGAKPFEADEEHLFFGREEDIEAVKEQVLLEQIVVLFAKSGMGKSSLLNAGLLPSIRSADHLEIIKLRFGAYQEGRSSLVDVLRDHLRDEAPPYELLQRSFPGHNSHWFHIKDRQLKRGKNEFVVIIDQFEEIFTYPEEEIAEFKLKLAELLHTEIPSTYRTLLAKFLLGENENNLSEEEIERLHFPMQMKLLVAIRSDRLSLLNNLSDVLPQILRTCYELTPLNAQAAEEAILNPAFMAGDFATPTFDFEDEALDHILMYLSQDGKMPIESFQLQILCQALERKVLTRGIHKITSLEVQDMDNIYENYYETQLSCIAGEEDITAVRIFLEEALILEEEERRLSLYEGQIFQSYSLTPKLLRELTDLHLLRAEPSLKGGYAYEIPHDSLVAPILKAKRKRKQAEAIAAEIAANEQFEKETLALKEKALKAQRKRRQALVVAGVMTVLAVLASISTFTASQEKKRANAAEKTAKEAQYQTATLNDSLKLQIGRLVEANYDNLLAQARQSAAEIDYARATDIYQEAIVLANSSQGDYLKNNREKAKEELAILQETMQRYGEFQQLMKEGSSFEIRGVDTYPQALNKYRQALSLDLDATTTQKIQNKINELTLEINTVFNQYKARGLLYLQQNNQPEACKLFRKARHLRPSDQEVNQKIKDNC